MSLTQLAARLPTVALTRLLLALLLICNLTLCVGWHGSPPSLDMASRPTATLTHLMPMAEDEIAAPIATMDEQHTPILTLSCHQGMGDEGAIGDGCQMKTGLSGAASSLPLFGMLLSLFILPLLLLPYLGATSHRLDHWLRNPFLRSRGAHPPSWPRRHLMLSVLRH